MSALSAHDEGAHSTNSSRHEDKHNQPHDCRASWNHLGGCCQAALRRRRRHHGVVEAIIEGE